MPSGGVAVFHRGPRFCGQIPRFRPGPPENGAEIARIRHDLARPHTRHTPIRGGGAGGILPGCRPRAGPCLRFRERGSGPWRGYPQQADLAGAIAADPTHRNPTRTDRDKTILKEAFRLIQTQITTMRTRVLPLYYPLSLLHSRENRQDKRQISQTHYASGKRCVHAVEGIPWAGRSGSRLWAPIGTAPCPAGRLRTRGRRTGDESYRAAPRRVVQRAAKEKTMTCTICNAAPARRRNGGGICANTSRPPSS